MVASLHHIPAFFYRGGTSRGLIFRASHLASLRPSARAQVLLQSLGSPDPNGRQIDGLGGGVSSLSKACVISAPGEGLDSMRKYGRLEGVEWADDVQRAKGENGWDVVYRFCQVGVRNDNLDWSGTCGNMLSAVAHAAVNHGIVQPTESEDAAISTQSIRILAAGIGTIFTCQVPIDHASGNVYLPGSSGEDHFWTTHIAGVPGKGTRIQCWTPLKSAKAAAEKMMGLVTSRELDTLNDKFKFSVIDAGLANIFLDWQEIGHLIDIYQTKNSVPPLQILQPAELDSTPELHQILEGIRKEICQTYHIPMTSAGPKIVLLDRVNPKHPIKFTDGSTLGADKPAPSLIVRAISVGNFHRTIPGTTLANLVLSQKYKGSLPSLISGSATTGSSASSVVVAHPAGIVEGTLRDEGGIPHSVVERTAREIMRGSVAV
ncbi:DUF453-domain-containing protein, partial [Atractiella rhizophila]